MSSGAPEVTPNIREVWGLVRARTKELRRITVALVPPDAPGVRAYFADGSQRDYRTGYFTRDGSRYKVLGVVLNDGTPLKSVEVSVDQGPWQQATMDPATNAKYSWKLFTYAWDGATPGEHTLVSRVTDVNGKVQPTVEQLEGKKTFLEDNAQFPRTVTIG